jgi:hypothetical protein
MKARARRKTKILMRDFSIGNSRRAWRVYAVPEARACFDG